MSSKCGKCDSDILTNQMSATCVECKRVFHPSCTRVGSEQNFTKARSKNWKCDDCTDETGSTTSNRSVEGEDKKTLLDAIRAIKSDINKNTDEKISSVLASMSAIAEELKQLKFAVSTLETSHCKLDERCERLENDNAGLRKVVASMRQQIQDSEQHQRASNIEIVGLPFTEGEDLYVCLEKTAAALNVAYKREDVSIAHRLRLYSRRRHIHPPIICQFVSRSVRSAWLSAARSKKHLAANEVHPSMPGSPVFINEHLTRENKMLLGKARRLMREQKLHHAGYFNGKVLIKVSSTEDSIHVTDISQLECFDES